MEHTINPVEVGGARWDGQHWRAVRTGNVLRGVFRVVRSQVAEKRCGMFMPDSWCDADSAIAATVQHCLREQETVLRAHGGGTTDGTRTDDGCVLIVRGDDGWRASIEWCVVPFGGAP